MITHFGRILGLGLLISVFLAIETGCVSSEDVVFISQGKPRAEASRLQRICPAEVMWWDISCRWSRGGTVSVWWEVKRNPSDTPIQTKVLWVSTDDLRSGRENQICATVHQHTFADGRQVAYLGLSVLGKLGTVTCFW